jgi:hypothetical protein
MKTILFILSLFFVSFVYSQTTNDTISYYKEITNSTEFTNKQNDSQKWRSDVKIYIDGICDSVAEQEVYKVVNELNELIDSIEITVVNNKDESNLIAFFGFCTDYDKFEPYAIPYSGNNYGLFVVYPKNNEITKGSFYVDVVRCEWLDTALIEKTKKHLVREELTQSLGLYNDSMKYPNSIFYQGFTYTTEYCDLDKKIIKIHYNQ